MNNNLSEQANNCIHKWAHNYYSSQGIGSFSNFFKGLTKGVFLSMVHKKAVENLFGELYNIYKVLPYEFGESGFFTLLIEYIFTGVLLGIAEFNRKHPNADLHYLYGSSFVFKKVPFAKLIPGKIGKDYRNLGKVQDRINFCLPIAIGYGIKEVFENTKKDEFISIVSLKNKIAFTVCNTLTEVVERELLDLIQELE